MVQQSRKVVDGVYVCLQMCIRLHSLMHAPVEVRGLYCVIPYHCLLDQWPARTSDLPGFSLWDWGYSAAAFSVSAGDLSSCLQNCTVINLPCA